MNTITKIAIKYILLIAGMPLIVLVNTFRYRAAAAQRILAILLSLFILTPVWLAGYAETISFIGYTAFRMGWSDQARSILVIGNSMLPGITSGSSVDLYNPYKYGLERLDVVSFANAETGGASYIKRIIGLPGESIAIKNGSVFINGQVLYEPYTLNRLPTYGNTHLEDCNIYRIPEGHYAVLGDNRTISQDSRVLGFIEQSTIQGVIPSDYTPEFSSTVPKTPGVAGTPDAERIRSAVQEYRTTHQAELLTPHDQLQKIAADRASAIASSLSVAKDADALEQTVKSHAYPYLQYHEFVTYGYLSEADIISQIDESTLERDIIRSPSYHHIGVGVATRSFMECTYPVISIVVGATQSTNYSEATKDQWVQELMSIDETYREFEAMTGSPGIDQNRLSDILRVLTQAKDIATRIKTKIDANQPLSDTDQADLTRYQTLKDEYARLIGNDPSPTESTSLSPLPARDPTPTPEPTNLSGNSQQEVEPGFKVTINSAEERDGNLVIRVTFANTSGSRQSFRPAIQLHSLTHGTQCEPFVASEAFDAGSIQTRELTCGMLEGSPLEFWFVQSTGGHAVVGTYRK